MQANGRLAVSFGKLPDFEETVLIVSYTKDGMPPFVQEQTSPLITSNRLESFTEMFSGEVCQTCDEEVVLDMEGVFLVMALADSSQVDADEVEEAKAERIGPVNW